MPPRAKRPTASRKKKKPAVLAVPENIPVIVACTPSTCVHRVFHFEHLFALSAAFIFIFSVLFSVSFAIRAQEFKATVSASVLPLEAYSDYKLKQMNPWQRYWSNLDPYQKLMVKSGAGLVVVLIPLGAVLWFQQRRVHHGVGAVHTLQASSGS